MSRAAAFLELIRTLAADPGPDAATALEVPGCPGAAPQDVRFAILVGAFDLLIDRFADHPEAGAVLRDALRTLIGAEGVLAFELHETAGRAEELDRAARMQQRRLAMTEGWLVPRLEREIAMFERRVAALERALAETP